MTSEASRPDGFTSSTPQSEDDPTIDLTEPSVPHATADEYSAWAERLRQKRVSAQQVIAGGPGPDTGQVGADTAGGTNWSSQNIFTESQRITENGFPSRSDPIDVSAAYAVLGLESGVTLAQVDTQYRKLVKQHHPDRFVAADNDVQQAHAEKFRAISSARDVVRQALASS